jgi:hypothetical protein
MTTKKNVNTVSKTEIAEALAITGVALSDGAANYEAMTKAGEMVASRQDQINEQVKVLRKGNVVIGGLKWKTNPKTGLSYSKSYDKKDDEGNPLGRNIDMIDQDKSCPINFGLVVAGLEGGASFEYIKRQVGKIANCVKDDKKFTFHDKPASSNGKKNKKGTKVGMTMSTGDLIENENNLALFFDDVIAGGLQAMLKKCKTQKERDIVNKALAMYGINQ